MSANPKKPAADWERIELDYRAGLLSVREIAAAHGISHTAINKRAKAGAWVRRLPQRGPTGLPVEDDRAGFLYVIYVDAPDRFYKIGRAVSLAERLSSHQCSSPFKVYVACAYYVGDAAAEERALHLLFSGQCVRGEWFRLSGDDLRQIAARSLLLRMAHG